MPVIADTHVHIYPCYNLADVLRNASRNMDRLGSMSQCATGAREGWEHVLFLTERSDCHIFREFKEKGLGLEHHDCISLPTNEEEAIIVEMAGSGRLYLIAGRQIITKEGLEILALMLDKDIPDGQPISEVICKINDAGGTPVLSWAPGKWFFDRGRIVREVIESFAPGRLLLGDTTLRPTIWPEPALMRTGRLKGLGLVAGSDPLPFSGEERHVGKYGVVLEGNFDPDRPIRSLRPVMRSTSSPFVTIGERGNAFDVLRRLKKNADAKKAGRSV